MDRWDSLASQPSLLVEYQRDPRLPCAHMPHVNMHAQSHKELVPSLDPSILSY